MSNSPASMLKPLASCLMLAALNASAGTGPLTATDVVQLARVSEPAVSPDGKYVAFSVRRSELEAGHETSELLFIDLRKEDALPRALTEPAAAIQSSPQWAPDGRSVYFLSARSGSMQVWRARIDSNSAAVQITDFPLEVTTFRVSPRGDRLAVSMDVFPECDDLACTARRVRAQDDAPTRGRAYDRLFIRHWNQWKDGRQSRLFVAPLQMSAPLQKAVSVTNLDADVPAKPNGGNEDYVFSPDGRSLVFSARIKAKSEPWSTNFDLFEVSIQGGEIRNLTRANPAWDAQPAYSPDGRWLAWLATRRPGFESDRFELVLLDRHTGKTRRLASQWDRSVLRFAFAADSRSIFALTDHLGQRPLWSIDLKTAEITPYTASGEVTDFAIAPRGVIYARASLTAPPDLYFGESVPGRAARRLTALNADRLSDIRLAEYEEFTFPGWNGETVHGHIMKPAQFEPGKRYPLAFLIHGGPQVSYGNRWDYRWNQQVFASAGYAVVFIDYHGSPGYGQAFTDSVSGDWGEKPLEDLRKGLAFSLHKYPWIEGGRVCALGPSFGGYLVNWIAGQWPDGFRCLVNHAGTFDTRMDYYSTDELWFEEWENGGTQYDQPERYEKYNPIHYVAKWRTPMLVTHGMQDFRVPYLHGVATFTALQRRGIDSRLILFPDEAHRIMEPRNSVQWYAEVLAWLDKWLGD